MKRLMMLVLALMLAAGYFTFAAAQDQEDGYIDHYTKGNFSKHHDVYSGPGETYYRANEGKAMYGSGAVRYYGSLGDGWMLIGYSLNGQGYRLGYIKASFEEMNTKGEDRVLTLVSAGAMAVAASDFYENPGVSEHISLPLCQLKEGAAVKLLGQFSADWTYIQIDSSYLGKPARGFVKSGSVVPVVKGTGKAGDSASGSLLADGVAQLRWETTALGWNRTVEITSNGDWTAYPQATWISLTADGSRLKIQLSENTSTEPRQGEIRITNASSAARIIIIQSGAE